jgi:hypothetical protein
MLQPCASLALPSPWSVPYKRCQPSAHFFGAELFKFFPKWPVGHCSSLPMNGSQSRRKLDLCLRFSAGGRRFAPRETSCSISEPLAFGADDRAVGSGDIINPERDSVVVPEIELGSVAMQMCLANVEIAAVDTALEDREEVLDRVGVPERASDVFLRTVVDRAVAGELVSHRPIDRCIVSHQIACLVHVRGDDRLQGPLR